MCTLVHTEEARVVAITRRSRTGRDATYDSSRQATLLVCAEFGVATAARDRVPAWEKSALARAYPSRRHSRGATYSRLRRRSLFIQPAGSAGSAPHVRVDAGYGVASAAAGVVSRSVAVLGHVYAPCVLSYTQHRVRAITRRSRTGRDATYDSGRQASLLVCAEFGVATAARGRVPAWETRTLARSSPVASSFPRRAAPSSSSAVALQSASR